MENIYAFYLDTYLINCVLINCAIYILTCKLYRFPVLNIIKRIICCAVGTAIAQTIVILVCRSFLAYKIISAIIIIPLSQFILFKVKTLINIIRIYLLSLVVTLIVGGIATALPKTHDAFIILAFVIGYILICFISKHRRRFQDLYQVKFNQGEWMHALYDSGNRLVNKKDGRPVHIIAKEMLSFIDGEEYGEIEYETIGAQKGVIKLYQVSDMVVKYNGRNIEYSNVLLGVSENSFEGKAYKIILNENVFYS